LLGAGSGTDDQPIPESLTFVAGDTGGEYNHTVTIPELPSHRHIYNESYILSSKEDRDSGSLSLGVRLNEQTGLTGGDQSHNNLQPYVAVYTWKRTA
jgi:microcystin-dependent protein